MAPRTLTTAERQRIEEKLEVLIAAGKGDHEIDDALADFIRTEFGLAQDRAEATAKAYGASWRKAAISTCTRAFRLRLADLYPDEEIPALSAFEILESDVHDDQPLDEEKALALCQAARLSTRFWRSRLEARKRHLECATSEQLEAALVADHPECSDSPAKLQAAIERDNRDG